MHPLGINIQIVINEGYSLIDLYIIRTIYMLLYNNEISSSGYLSIFFFF